MMRSTQIFTFINMTFPGGVQQFDADGGMVVASPLPDEYLILVPNPPERWKDEIPQWNANVGYKLRVISKLNFMGMSVDEVDALMRKAVERIFSEVRPLQIAVTGVVLLVLQVLNDVQPDEVKAIAQIMRDSFPDLSMGYVIAGSIVEPIHMDGTPEQSKPSLIALKEEHPDRDKVIGEDEITNLKITLGSCDTIDDFINSL